jgi:lysophospholipase L1-like esterase
MGADDYFYYALLDLVGNEIVSDNFNDNSLDTAIWNETDSGTNVNEQNQQLELVGNGSWNANGVVTDYQVQGKYAEMEISVTTPSTPATANFLFGLFKSSTLSIVAEELAVQFNGADILVKYSTGSFTDIGVDVAASTTYTVKIEWHNTEQFIYIKGGSFGSSYAQILERYGAANADGAYCHMQTLSASHTYIADDFSATQEKTDGYVQIDDSFTDNSFDTSVLVKTESDTDNVIEQNQRLEITGSGAWNQNGVVSVHRSDRHFMVMEVDITTPTSFGTNDDFMLGFCRHEKLTTSDVSRFMVLIDASEANNIYIKNKTTDIATGETLAASTTYTFKLLWTNKGVVLIVNGGAFSNEIIYSNGSYGYVPNLMHAHIQSYSTQTYIVDNLYVDKKTKTAVTDYTTGVHRYKLNETSWGSPGDVLDSIGTAHSDPIGGAFTRPLNGSNTKEGSFDGSGDSVDLQIASESIPTTGSMSFFMNITTWNNNRTPFDNTANTGGNAYLFRLQETSGKIKFQTAGDVYDAGELDQLESNAVLETNRTYFITVTWNVSTKHKAIYIDGVLDAEKTIVGTMYFPTIFNSPMIGEGSLASWDFDGQIRDWTLWNVEIPISRMVTVMADDGHDWPKWDYFAVGIGDSIMAGTGGGQILSHIETKNLGASTLNKGTSGETSTQVEARFVTDAVNNNGERVYLVAGTNDYYYDPPIPVATTKPNLLTMMDHCEKEGQDFIINEVPPVMYREVCADRGLKFGASYQELARNSTSFEDDLDTAYTSDGIHPNDTGKGIIADFLDLELVPERQIQWGHADYYSTPNDESWDWWIGTGSITGDGDTGTLSLDSGEYMASPVKPISDGANTRVITITPIVTAGTVTVKYRTSANNFDRDDAASWTTYAGPVVLTDQFNFVQTRLEHLTGAPAQVSDVKLEFSALPSITALSFERGLPGLFRGVGIGVI